MEASGVEAGGGAEGSRKRGCVAHIVNHYSLLLSTII